jgi:hypothetical protein
MLKETILSFIRQATIDRIKRYKFFDIPTLVKDKNCII